MLFLGIDMGTSYYKMAVFNERGQLKGSGRVDAPQNSSRKMARLHPASFWKALLTCLNITLKSASAKVEEIGALSYASQANTFTLFNKKDEPVTPLILWTDESATLDETLHQFTLKKEWQQTTGIGIGLSNGFCINKCRWLQTNEPDLWQQTQAVLTLPDYFTFCMTGQKIVDHSTASLLGLMNIDTKSWWPAALYAAGIPQEFMSTISEVAGVGFRLRKQNPLHLNSNTLLVTGGLDHHIAALGAGIGKNIHLTESTGTVIATVLYGNNSERGKDICVSPGLSNSTWFKMAFDVNGAAALEWYWKTFGSEHTLEELIQMAQSVPSAEGLVAHPCANRYAGKDGFLNQNPKHHHGHYVRALMESTAKSLKELIKKVDCNNDISAVFATGGGAKSALWTEIKEAVTHRKFYRNQNPEAACCGAAMAAAAGSGFFTSVAEAQLYWLQ